jgi:hypothetical protein
MPQLRSNAKRFFIYFRMSSNCFDEIINLIDEDIRKETAAHGLRPKIPFSHELRSNVKKLFSLYYLIQLRIVHSIL